MGQYHLIVNLDHREFIHPHKLGAGLKAWEQIANPVSTPQALFALLMCANGRGGGDLTNPPGSNEPVIGRWAGDRIAVVGDYAEDDNLPGPLHDPVEKIYDLCREGVYRDITHLLRPLLEHELGVRFESRPQRLINLDGSVNEWESWSIRRAPVRGFSVIDAGDAEEAGGRS